MKIKTNRLIVLCFVLVTALLSVSACEKKEKDNVSTDTEEYVLETIEEQVLFDEAGVKATVTGIVDTEAYGKGLVFVLENATMKDLTFDCKKLITNGIMAPDLFGERVQAGETVETVGFFGTEMLNYLGIDNVGEIQVEFDCYDTINYTSTYRSDLISIKTSEYENMDTEVDLNGDKLFENHGITIYGKMASDDIFDQAMLFLVDNDTDSEFLFKSEGVTIDGEYNEYLYGFNICENSSTLYYLEFGSGSAEEDAESESIGNTFEMDFEIYDRADVSLVGKTGALKLNMK